MPPLQLAGTVHRQSFRRLLLVACAALSLAASGAHAANDGEDIGTLLRTMDAVKMTNYTQFVQSMDRLSGKIDELQPTQREFYSYLKGWHQAFQGNYQEAFVTLDEVLREAKDETVRFRATVTLINILSIAKRYEQAFAKLSVLLEQLPRVTDKDARMQGLGVVAQLYNYVAEYEGAKNFAQQLIDEDPLGRGLCMGSYLKLDAMFKSSALTAVDRQFENAIDTCSRLGELVFANLMRINIGRIYIASGQADAALDLLTRHYPEVQKANYQTLSAGYNALLSHVYLQKRNLALAKQYAQVAIDNAVPDQYTEPLTNAYRLLYEIARQQGDIKAALLYHEKYSIVDKGYLDDVSTRQLAYQRVKHETLANKAQIDTLNKQNEVLKLKQDLAGKAVETSRLYIVILTMVLIFIALFAYRTKRSQVHFRKLSRLDGLTEIFNRPHFLDQAKQVLRTANDSKHDACVILCDLDHFKSINDKFGHATGDVVLRKTVEVFQKHLRANDIVGRLGGEEFGFLLPGCDLLVARERCELIRGAIAEVEICEGGVTATVSASFGIATTGSSGYELRQLLLHADKALYHAKRSGRNLVALYDADTTKGKSVADESIAERSIRGAA